MVLLIPLAVVAIATLAWILKVTRTYNFQTMHETDFWAKRLRVRLALAGVLWMVGLTGGIALFVLCSVVPPLRPFATIPLILALLGIGLGIPALLIRSATLLSKHLQ